MSDSNENLDNFPSRDNLPPAAKRWWKKALPADYVDPETIKIEQVFIKNQRVKSFTASNDPKREG
jgi:hypothetical protein